jgi:putative oxidoreductase
MPKFNFVCYIRSMKRFFRTAHTPTTINIALLIVRICIASFMLTHGVPKLCKLFTSQDVEFADPIGIGVSVSLTLTIFAEVFCSILILLGLGTRFAVIPLIITMSVAAFIVHAGDSFSKQELSLHYLLIYVILLVTGSGRYSADQLLFGRYNRQSAGFYEV